MSLDELLELLGLVEDGEVDEELSPDVLPEVLPAPAEPLGVEELEDGELDEAPPLALSFFGVSVELDEELAPEPDGVALEDGEVVVPEEELEDEPGAVLGEVVAPELDGEVVVEDELEPAGVREALSVLLQPASNAPPNAREIARARVETFMWPPWLGYG